MPDLSTWRTGITRIAPSRIEYRGNDIGSLIETGDLGRTLWLLLFGGEPDEGQADALRRALIAAMDHGVAAPSTLAARATASTRGPVPLAIAAGMIAFAGPAHGGAAEEIAKVMVEIHQQADGVDPEPAAREKISAILAAGARVPGFGHPYHARDPRVPGLLNGATTQRTYRTLAMRCEAILRELTGKDLRMNADTAVAALLLDAGLRPTDITLVTALGRAFGLAAHAREEQVREAPFRAPALETVVFEESTESAGRGS